MKLTSKIHSHLWAILWFALFFTFLTVGQAVAQQATAQLGGRVTDSTGAIIVGAQVTLRNSQTGVSRNTTTNKDGEYLFTLVPIGGYDLAVNGPSSTEGASGFSGNFGQVTSDTTPSTTTAYYRGPRLIQFALKVYF